MHLIREEADLEHPYNTCNVLHSITVSPNNTLYKTHLIREEADLEHRLGLRAARESVEHVEEDETGECHGCVARGYLVVRHLE